MNGGQGRRRAWRAAIATVFLAMCVGSGAKVLRKAGEGGTAFVRWMGDTERLWRGEMVYDTEEEGYPNLPMAALLLTPFHALGPTAGSLAWLALKCAIAAGIMAAAVAAARGEGPPLPEWQILLLLLLSMRVFVGDLTHGNINLVIGGLVALALACTRARRDFAAGLAIGCATVLKATPLLFVPYFIYKRRWRAVLGAAAAGVLFGWLIPGLALGFRFTHELTLAWYLQMVRPFAAGAPADYLRTMHMNQSLTGWLYRLLADTVAVAADARRGYDEVRINIASLDPRAVSLAVKALGACLVAAIAWFARTPREDRRHLGNLGEFALVFLAMLMLSERSWKHHYVLIVFAHAFLLRYLLAMRPPRGRRRAAAWLLGAALLFHYGFGAGTLGRHWSDVAEAYGAYLLGAFCLFAGCAAVLAWLRADGWLPVPRGAADTGHTRTDPSGFSLGRGGSAHRSTSRPARRMTADA